MGRSREEKEGRRVRAWGMISTVFFLPKLLCAAQWSSGLHAERFWTPMCRPPRLMPPGWVIEMYI